MANIIHSVSLLVVTGAFSILNTLLIIILFAKLKKKQKFGDFTPNISVILPVHNEQHRVGKCLNSILESDYPKSKIEIVVIDDLSTDNTLSVLKKFKKRFKKFQILQGNHTGKSNALNLGVVKARNNFLLILDADVQVHENFITKMVAPLQSNIFHIL